MSNATLFPLIHRPTLRRSFKPEYYELIAIDIQRMVRGTLARKRTPFLRRLPFRLERSTNEHELAPLFLPEMTPNRPLLSPLRSPPRIYRLTREDERRLVTPEEIVEMALAEEARLAEEAQLEKPLARKLEEEFAKYP